MILSMNGQIFMFLVAFATGVCGGFGYGIISVFRKYVAHNIIVVYLEDFLYFVIYAIIAFLVMLYFNYADIRGYIYLGIWLGFIIYFLLLHKIVLKILRPIIFLIRLMSQILLAPFLLIIYPFRKLYIYCKKYLKNIAICEKITNVTIRKIKKR